MPDKPNSGRASNVSRNADGSFHVTHSIGGLRHSRDIYPDGTIKNSHITDQDTNKHFNREPWPWEPNLEDLFGPPPW